MKQELKRDLPVRKSSSRATDASAAIRRLSRPFDRVAYAAALEILG